MELIINCVILGFIVIVVESNFHVMVDALFSAVHFRVGKALLHTNIYVGSRNSLGISSNRFVLAFISISFAAISSLAPLLRLLQYLMSIVQLKKFLARRFEIFGLPIYLCKLFFLMYMLIKTYVERLEP